MAEIKMRYNSNAQEVELLVDNEVAFSSGKDVFESWVKAYNDANPQPEKVLDVENPVEEKVVEPGNEVVDTPSEASVDSTESGESDKGEESS